MARIVAAHCAHCGYRERIAQQEPKGAAGCSSLVARLLPPSHTPKAPPSQPAAAIRTAGLGLQQAGQPAASDADAERERERREAREMDERRSDSQTEHRLTTTAKTGRGKTKERSGAYSSGGRCSTEISLNIGDLERKVGIGRGRRHSKHNFPFFLLLYLPSFSHPNLTTASSRRLASLSNRQLHRTPCSSGRHGERSASHAAQRRPSSLSSIRAEGSATRSDEEKANLMQNRVMSDKKRTTTVTRRTRAHSAPLRALCCGDDAAPAVKRGRAATEGGAMCSLFLSRPRAPLLLARSTCARASACVVHVCACESAPGR